MGHNLIVLNDDGLQLHLSRLPQDQPFTAAEANALGVHHEALCSLVRAGQLRRPVRSAYVHAALPDSLTLRLEMLRRVVPEWCVVTDHTAAWLHAGDAALLPNSHTTTAKPDVFRRPGSRALRNDLVRSGERMLRSGDTMEIGGLLVTTPMRTASDIGRLFPRDVAMWGLDAMLATGAFTRDELLRSLPRFNRQRGVVQLRVLAPLADAGSESFGESALRLRWYDAGLPRPTCQLPIATPAGVFRLDMGLEEERFGAEYDGERWHTGADVEAHDRARREALADEAMHVEVFTRAHVFGQQQGADRRLRAAYRAWRAR